MNKPNILLYAVSVSDRSSLSSLCAICGKDIKWSVNILRVEFDYYDYIARENNTYEVSICQGCFKDKIKNKPVKSLSNYIPLLKIKGREIIKSHFDYYDPHGVPIYPSYGNDIFDEHIYSRIATKRDVKAFINRARRYELNE